MSPETAPPPVPSSNDALGKLPPTLEALMHRQVHTVHLDDTAADVDRLFARESLQWAPVADQGGAVIGVVSRADLAQLMAMQRDPASVKAWQLCTYKPVAVEVSTPLPDVARLMVERHIHHVMVMDRGQLAGVLSALDFVRLHAAPPAR